MALLTQIHSKNIAGDFYVDTTCIDCDLCRQIAPQIYRQSDGQSIVYQQPQNPSEELAALKALVSCPTSSIGAKGNHPAQEAINSYPEQIEENVYFCGFASESSFGASSYLIVRPNGNILVDSPRFNKPLAKQIEKLGGIHQMFLTHRDDVADHQKWVDTFQASRIIHQEEVYGNLAAVEQITEETEPFQLESDLLVIPTPGHTKGHLVLLYQNKFLFTGDHLWWSPKTKSLNASNSVCWYSWSEQIESMEKLGSYKFEWVLPGHGRRFQASGSRMQQELEQCIIQMKSK